MSDLVNIFIGIINSIILIVMGKNFYTDYRNPKRLNRQLLYWDGLVVIEHWMTLGMIEEMTDEQIRRYVANLCGLRNERTTRWNADTLNTLRLLSGPNGWAVYKMLKIRHNL